MPRLSLSLLRSFQATLDGVPLTSFESNKVRALLVYLAVEAHQTHPRDVLAGLLWPRRSNRDALSNLRYALYNLRNVLGDRQADPPFLIITRRALQFNTASDQSVDVKTFQGQVGGLTLRTNSREEPAVGLHQASDLRAAVALYRGPFLHGFSLDDSPAFEEWLLLKREQIDRQMMVALRLLAHHEEEIGNREEARGHVRRLLELEPWDEGAHRHLMRLLALDGRRNAALSQYGVCRDILVDELGVEPSSATTLLYERIRDGGIPRAQKERCPSAPSRSLASRSTAPFVGRERELAKRNRFLEEALNNHGRIAFVTGEAGSGKTTLIQAFASRALQAHRDLVVTLGACSAHQGIGDPYLPFRETLQLLAGDIEPKRAGGTLTGEHAQRLWRTLPLVARALMDEGPDLIDRVVSGEPLLLRLQGFFPHGASICRRLESLIQRETVREPATLALGQPALFEQMTRVLLTLAKSHPLLLLLDDLQWTDPGSASLFFHLGRRLAHSRILLVGAYRPGGIVPGQGGERHPLAPVIHELTREFGDAEVRLGEADGRQFVDAFLDSEPNHLGAPFRQALFRYTGGNPLFTTEFMRGLQARGDLVRDEEGRWTEDGALNWERLPPRVEAVVAERIELLPPDWQKLLLAASVEGETFTAEVMARVQGLDEDEVVRWLSGPLSKRHHLVRAHSIRRADGRRLSRYRFRHILFQSYLYRSLDEVERGQLHEAVGIALETVYGERVADMSGPLARHFEAAGMIRDAVDYRLQAGKRAVMMSAHKAALAHYTRGIELLQDGPMPDSPERARRELALQIALSTPLQALKSYGAPERGHAYARARQLCDQIGERPEVFQTLLLQWSFDMPRAEHRKALELAKQLLTLARQMENPAQVAVAHMALGISFLYRGDFIDAGAHLERALAGYDAERHHPLALPIGQDLRVTCLAYRTWVTWILGYPDQAVEQAQETIDLARELNHPYSLGFALGIAGCVIHLLCGAYDAALGDAQALLELWEKHGFVLYQAWGLCVKGRVLTERGQIEKGLANLRDGIAIYKDVGIMASHTQQLANFIEACRNAGESKEGLDAAEKALSLVEKNGERHFEAEIHLRKGELLMMTGNKGQMEEAESYLLHATEIAREQQARSWELRAVTNLSRLWQQQGRQREAHTMLKAIYSQFTEGFDTLDLREARMLLDEGSTQSPCPTDRGIVG